MQSWSQSRSWSRSWNHPSRTFCPEPQLELPGLLIGAELGVGAGAVQKFPEFKYLEPEPDTRELDHFTRNRSWKRRRRDIKLGAGARAGMIP